MYYHSWAAVTFYLRLSPRFSPITNFSRLPSLGAASLCPQVFNHVTSCLKGTGSAGIILEDSFRCQQFQLTYMTISSGVIVGTTTSLLFTTAIVNKFFGIPFAAPPQRCSPPIPAPKRSQPLSVTKLLPACLFSNSAIIFVLPPLQHITDKGQIPSRHSNSPNSSTALEIRPREKIPCT